MGADRVAEDIALTMPETEVSSSLRRMSISMARMESVPRRREAWRTGLSLSPLLLFDWLLMMMTLLSKLFLAAMGRQCRQLIAGTKRLRQPKQRR